MADDPWAVAYHEAGHAVMMTLTNVPFGRVTIRESDDGATGGHVDCDLWAAHRLDADDVEGRGAIRRYIMSIVAGPAAERRWCHNTWWQQRQGADGDLVAARDLAERVEHPQHGADAIVDHWWAQASHRLAQHADAVDLVAAALMKYETLTQRDVWRIVAMADD